jgi:hypothetical protein
MSLRNTFNVYPPLLLQDKPLATLGCQHNSREMTPTYDRHTPSSQARNLSKKAPAASNEFAGKFATQSRDTSFYSANLFGTLNELVWTSLNSARKTDLGEAHP